MGLQFIISKIYILIKIIEGPRFSNREYNKLLKHLNSVKLALALSTLYGHKSTIIIADFHA